MPFATPTPSTEALWKGKLLRWPIVLDLIIFITLLWTLAFALVSAFESIDSYYNEPWYSWGESDYTTAIVSYVFSNLFAPVISIVISTINIAFYTTRTLHPVQALVCSVFMFAGWGVACFFWLDIGEYGEDYLSPVPPIAKFAGGIIVFTLELMYMVVAAIAVHRYRKAKLRVGTVEEYTKEVDNISLVEQAKSTPVYNRECRQWTPGDLSQLPTSSLPTQAVQSTAPRPVSEVDCMTITTSTVRSWDRSDNMTIHSNSDVSSKYSRAPPPWSARASVSNHVPL